MLPKAPREVSLFGMEKGYLSLKDQLTCLQVGWTHSPLLHHCFLHLMFPFSLSSLSLSLSQDGELLKDKACLALIWESLALHIYASWMSEWQQW
jgi:hypothetical protein